MEEIELKCAEATSKLVPTKSSARYEKEYQLFNVWRKTYKVENGLNENILLAYFLDISKKMNPATMWAKYSMLKSMLMVKVGGDISKYPKLVAFIKRQAVGHQANKSKVLTREEVNRFIKDEEYLLMKVIAMIGIASGCRREELYHMALKDIEDCVTKLIITIPISKTNTKRVFTVLSDDNEGINFLEILREYVKPRPKNMKEDFLFLGYRRGTCVPQRAGILTIGGAPKKIAGYLKLEHPEKYTRHCFRRTSATFLANAGADLPTLKRHGAWRSSSVAEQYIEDSLENKTKAARMIQNGENFIQVLQTKQQTISTTTTVSSEDSVPKGIPAFSLQGNSHCTVTVNYNNYN
uniref:Tyr recombinase domain-containing protein n=1 Tax=Anoplophora glabripennis TaxID=217634 RepID=V5G484_ANOGL